ncbi:MAG: (2Fe-2S) ferredoxin domain-containing protein [Chloroflexi bacterium]|nr:(2Fe-2S) ferredoxin domain-containing protein [Chloroflexota bacterium]OJV89650.1 MAG: hypothetical protein BGO39_37490 [Chloroflexi bacterium 54-19]
MSIDNEEQAPEKEAGADHKRYLLVCQGLFCMGRGSYKLLGDLRQRKERGEFPGDVEIRPYYCFNGCSHGPNIVCYPEKVWFERVNPANLEQVVTYLDQGIPATDPLLNQGRVIEVVRRKAYLEIKEELGF